MKDENAGAIVPGGAGPKVPATLPQITDTRSGRGVGRIAAPVPIPVQGKHPLRFGIHGDEDKTEELKKIIEGYEGLHPGLKAFLRDELAKIPDSHNAACVHLHDVEQPGAGFDLNISMRWRLHGRKGMRQGVAVKAGSGPVAPPVPAPGGESEG